jgi:Peroxiredoxin
MMEVMSMSRENKLLSPGDKAPDFELPEAVSGEAVSLSGLLGNPLMIYFGRGTW